MTFSGIKRALAEVAWRAGYQIVPRWQMRDYPLATHLRKLFAYCDVDCVIDVGGNKGQYAEFLRQQVGYRGHIFSVEPIKQNYEILSKKCRADGHWTCSRLALGKTEGRLSLNIMAEDSFSSFLQPNEDQPFMDNKVAGTEEVDVRRLDELLKERGLPFSRIYLKLDTQGFDLEVFKGATGVLDAIVAIQSELAFTPIYKSMPTYDEALPVFMHQGFRVSNMFPVSIENFRAVEFDCVLIRDTTIPK